MTWANLFGGLAFVAGTGSLLVIYLDLKMKESK